MATDVITVEDSRVVIGLSRLGLQLAQRRELMEEIGAGQLVSIRKTFREEGSPGGSWMPLAPSTVRRYGKRAAGHKLLVLSGRLLNSIKATPYQDGVVIGTNLKYAAVHQFGSADRSFGVGPRTEEQEKDVLTIKKHDRKKMGTLSVRGLKGPGYLTERLEGPELPGRKRPVNRVKLIGPPLRTMVRVKRIVRLQSIGEHARHQNIPPRPYMVFRPEDPERIRGQVETFVLKARADAGLEGEA